MIHLQPTLEDIIERRLGSVVLGSFPSFYELGKAIAERQSTLSSMGDLSRKTGYSLDTIRSVQEGSPNSPIGAYNTCSKVLHRKLCFVWVERD